LRATTGEQESISPTFYERICSNILAQIKSLTFTASIKKLCAKLLYKKAAHEMLVKLTLGSPVTNNDPGTFGTSVE
jgi:hypothetical protein